MKKNVDLGLVLIRITIAVPMLFYGISKLLNGVDSIQQLLISKGLPGFIAYGVYMGEVMAPLLILVGFRTRIASIIFSFNCIVALLLTQTQQFFELNNSGGWSIELLFIYSLASLSLALTGGGKHSISTHSNWD